MYLYYVVYLNVLRAYQAGPYKYCYGNYPDKADRYENNSVKTS
jgi:hypothetical protein